MVATLLRAVAIGRAKVTGSAARQEGRQGRHYSGAGVPRRCWRRNWRRGIRNRYSFCRPAPKPGPGPRRNERIICLDSQGIRKCNAAPAGDDPTSIGHCLVWEQRPPTSYFIANNVFSRWSPFYWSHWQMSASKPSKGLQCKSGQTGSGVTFQCKQNPGHLPLLCALRRDRKVD